MVATMLIELVLAAYTIGRYKLNSVSRLVVLLLVALATFQLAEFYVCTGYEGNVEAWSRLGFVAITTLPPLGIHLMHVLAGKKPRQLVLACYAAMSAFIGYFLLYESAFTGHQCTGNYVIFQLGEHAGGWYSAYYFGLLLVGIVQGLRWIEQLNHKSITKKATKRIQAMQGLLVGYLVFLVPTAIANSIDPSTRRGVPSIMCGFAVLLALILALFIMPRAGQLRSKSRS